MARQRPFQIQTEIPSEALLFDADAFDTQIRSQGVKLDHFIAMRCPVGMTDLDDDRRPHHDHVSCSNGYLYKNVGTITCLLTSNQKTSQQDEVGIMDHATFNMTAPRTYDDQENKLVNIAPFDRFFIHEDNVVVIYWQLFLAHQSGQERLNFPVVEVIRLVDAKGREYLSGCDFDIIQGQVVWKSQNRPGVDPETGRGLVCSIRYTYRPFFYVGPILHDVRVAMNIDQQTGESKIIRMPQSALVHREFVFLNEQHDHEAKDSTSARQMYGPAQGGFGPK